MTIYNFNLGIGWASSGVEYAQAYRARVFRQLGQSAKFIFVEMFAHDNIQHLTANIGLKDDEVIWLYQYFTDIPIAASSYPVQDVLTQLGHEIVKKEKNEHILRVFFEGQDSYVTLFLKKDDHTIVERVEFVSNGSLIRKDYYSCARVFTEYYAPKEQRAHVYLRRFFNLDGSVAYEEVVDGDNSVYFLPDAVLYAKEEFVAHFMRCLNVNSNDTLIIDRSTGIAQAILENKQDAKVAAVVHADHFSVNATTDTHILWNNYYEYVFTHADAIDMFMTSTPAQTRLLQQQFEQYTAHRPQVVTIPVGSLLQLCYPKQARKPFSLVTASRLAAEKHIDWLIKAVVKAKQTLPELTFDIYGSGVEQSKLTKIIQDHHAQAYIQLKGHHDMTSIYVQYQAYVSASTSEGFGLTLMEAIGSGLPIIGFDVPYGNPTFVDDMRNGYLITKDENDTDGDIVERIAQCINQLFTQADLDAFCQHAYHKASGYVSDVIEQQWAQALKEVHHDKFI